MYCHSCSLGDSSTIKTAVKYNPAKHVSLLLEKEGDNNRLLATCTIYIKKQTSKQKPRIQLTTTDSCSDNSLNFDSLY